MNKIILPVIFFNILFFGCQDKNSATKKNQDHHGHQHQSKIETYYTCSMHPEIKEKGPGKCPICHMSLTKVEIDNSEEEISNPKKEKEKEIWQCKDYPDVTGLKEEVCPIDGSKMIRKPKENKAFTVIGKVKLRKSQLEHFKPEYFPATTMMMNKKIRVLGSVLQSEDKESNIPARIGGRVEKVYIKSTGSFVKVGEPVIELYGPKLITAGEEYLIAKRSFLKTKSKEFKDILKQSEARLRSWGIKKFQYESWFKKGDVPRSITIYSESTGIVRKRNAIIGKYFKEGQNFFELSDLSDVWVEMDVYEQDSSLVALGQKVQMQFTSLPGVVLEGEIDFIDPVLNPKSRTLKIRTTIKNTSGKLKPGMVADARINIKLEGHPLVIPRTAVIDTGKRKVVWVKVTDKRFMAKVIKTGHESEGYVEVKQGLMEGEEVVIEGNFLLDAQAQLFGGYEDIK